MQQGQPVSLRGRSSHHCHCDPSSLCFSALHHMLPPAVGQLCPHDTLAWKRAKSHAQCCKSVALFGGYNKHRTEMTPFWWRDTSKVLLSLLSGWSRQARAGQINPRLSVLLYARFFEQLIDNKRSAGTPLTALIFLCKHFQWHRGAGSQGLTSNVAPSRRT